MTGICADCGWSQWLGSSRHCDVCLQISLLRSAITYNRLTRQERVAMERVLRGLVEFLEELVQRGVGGRPVEAGGRPAEAADPSGRTWDPWGEECVSPVE